MLARLEERRTAHRPPHSPPLPPRDSRPRDKEPHYRRRNEARAYIQRMVQSRPRVDDAPEGEITLESRFEGIALARLVEFALWLDKVADQQRVEHRRTQEEMIKLLPINQSTYFRWKAWKRWRDWKSTGPAGRAVVPTRGAVQDVCDSLGLPAAVPFEILGWGVPASAQIRAMSIDQLRNELIAADDLLQHERITDEDADVYLRMVKMLTAELRLKIEQRERQARTATEDTGGAAETA